MIVIITENILAVIIITFKYFLNTFGYLLKKICSPLETNWLVMTCGIILIQLIEERHTVDILIHKKILPNVENKLIKANFKDLVTFRINILFYSDVRNKYALFD